MILSGCRPRPDLGCNGIRSAASSAAFRRSLSPRALPLGPIWFGCRTQSILRTRGRRRRSFVRKKAAAKPSVLATQLRLPRTPRTCVDHLGRMRRCEAGYGHPSDPPSRHDRIPAQPPGPDDCHRSNSYAPRCDGLARAAPGPEPPDMRDGDGARKRTEIPSRASRVDRARRLGDASAGRRARSPTRALAFETCAPCALVSSRLDIEGSAQPPSRQPRQIAAAEMPLGHVERKGA